jgi:hypothetical protein
MNATIETTNGKAPPTIDLPPLSARAKPLIEETTGWPEHRFFFRIFSGGLPHLERYLNLAPVRIELVQFSFDGLGTPVALFRNVDGRTD